MLRALAGGALALGLAASAQPPGPQEPETLRPMGAGRVVRSFDFEEYDSNPGEVPRYWFRSQEDLNANAARNGFPYWNRATIMYVGEGGIAASGKGAVRLPTSGGSTSLVLQSGVVPIFRQADYYVSASVKTEGLSFSAACLTARFLDASGQPIPGTDRRSDLLRSEDWKEIGVALVGDKDDAAYVQIELLLLQPEQASPESGGARPVWRQDVSGAAWFDDVAVIQLPRVELATRSPANIEVGDKPPELTMSVRDLTGEEVRILVRVVDAEGNECDRMERKMGGGATETIWQPKVKKFGWYRAVMDILGPRGRVGGAYTDFLWIPPRAKEPELITRAANRNSGRVQGRSRDASRFGINVDRLSPTLVPRLAGMLNAAGTGRVTIPAWKASLTPATLVAHTESVVPVVDSLLSDWQDVTISLDRVPDQLAADTRIPSDDPLTLLLTDSRGWMPYLDQLLDRYGQRVRHWQLGRIGDDRAFWRPSLVNETASLTEQLSRHVAGPLIDLPSRLDRRWSPAQLRALAGNVSISARVPAGLSPAGVGEAAAEWVSGTGARPDLTLVFELPNQNLYGVAAGPMELVKRAVQMWVNAGGASGPPVMMELEQPWTIEGEQRPQIMPRPELAAWATVVRMLEGRRVVGKYPIADGVVCFILAPIEGEAEERGGALVLWNESCPPDRAELNGFLGEGVLTLVDIYGNRSVLPTENSERTGRRASVRLAVSDQPVFIEGIDVELTRFISGLEVLPAFLESTNEQHERTIRLINPWGTAISGRLTILEPGGVNSSTGTRDRNWRISPRIMRFSADARQTIELPFTIAFSPTEEQGPKAFVADVELTAEKSYGIITIYRSLEVGVKNVVMDLAYAVRGNGPDQDVIIEAAVTNTGDQPLTLELTCFAPGLPRSKAVVSELAGGNQVVKRFTFAKASRALAGSKILISASDPDGTSRLNKSLTVQ